MKKCISVILTIFMVFSLIMIPINKVYGQADVTAPELISINANIRMYRNDHLKMYKITL